ncbi:MAG: hypothetical protein ABGY41_15820, partial [Candidatus Poribacteria bacterium]
MGVHATNGAASPRSRSRRAPCVWRLTVWAAIAVVVAHATAGTIVFRRSFPHGEDPEAGHIWLIDENGENERPWEGLPPGSDVPVWSRDGTMIAMRSDLWGSPDVLWVMGLRRRRPSWEDITDRLEIGGHFRSFTALSWAPNARRL